MEALPVGWEGFGPAGGRRPGDLGLPPSFHRLRPPATPTSSDIGLAKAAAAAHDQ